MKNEIILRKILAAAKRDRNRRRDPRYLNTMGFLVAKGFLGTNDPIPLLPNKKLRIEDAIWAGTELEPRILEVLPAAVLRLPKHFDLDAKKHPALFSAVQRLRRGDRDGEGFNNIPYKKIRVWAELPLRDGRTKELQERRVTKTFRFRPATIQRLKNLAKENRMTETEVLEKALMVIRKFS